MGPEETTIVVAGRKYLALQDDAGFIRTEVAGETVFDDSQKRKGALFQGGKSYRRTRPAFKKRFSKPVQLQNRREEKQPMKVTMIICQDSPEVIWNAFRLANMMLEGMDEVSIFLNGPCVRYEEFDSERFPLKKLAKTFTLSEGQLYA